jgi:CRISPR system Cascade subunit CasD
MTRRPYLLFRLAGVAAAFGAPAIGEARPLWYAPGKSAIAGLLAAALGLDRHDPAADALQERLGFACRSDRLGVEFRDFHTAQAASGGPYSTRRAELASGRVSVIVSERDYVCGASWTVALWRRGAEAPDLFALAAALRRPHAALYLGRRSCPLALPPAPAILERGSLRRAFAAYDALDAGLAPAAEPPGAAKIWADVDGVDEAGSAWRLRRDRARDPTGWLFADRPEVLAAPAVEDEP